MSFKSREKFLVVIERRARLPLESPFFAAQLVGAVENERQVS